MDATTRERLDQIIYNTPALIYTIEPSFPYELVWLCRNTEHVLGVDAEILLSREDRWLEYIHPDHREKVRENIERLINDPDTDAVKHRYRFKISEKEKWLFERVRAITEDDGEMAELIASAVDVTDEMEAVEKLRSQQRYTENLLDALPDIVYVINEDGAMLDWNESLIKVTGYSGEEISSMNALAFFPEEEHGKVSESIRRKFETGEAWVETRIETKSGEIIPYEFHGVTMEGGDGTVVVGIGRDITERKALEDELNASKENLEKRVKERTRELEKAQDQLKEAQRLAQTGSWEWNMETDEMTWSAEMYRLHGYEPGEVEPVLESVLERIHPEDKEKLRDIAEKIVAKEEEAPIEESEYRIILPDGEIRHVVARITVKGGEREILRGTIQDITERKEIHLELEETNRFLDAIVENIPNMIFVKGAENLEFVRFNKAGEELLGIDREEMIGKTDYDFFPEEEADSFRKKDREALEKGEVIDIPQEKIETQHGTRILHTKKIPVTDEEGDPKFLLGISEDITDLKERERELILYHALVDQSPDDVYLFRYDKEHGDLRLIEASQSAYQHLGYTEDELVGKPLSTFGGLPEDVRENLPNSLYEHRKMRFDITHTRKDGTTYPVEAHARVVIYEEDIYLIKIARDITEQRELERAKDEFTSMISHEMKSPLFPIQGYAELIAQGEMGPVTAEQEESLDIIRRNTESLTQLINDMLDASKLQLDKIELNIQEVDLVEIILDMKNDLQLFAGTNDSEIIVDVPGELVVECDRQRISQVLDNLVKNAVLYKKEGEHNRITVRVGQDGNQAVVSVEDEGRGMTREEQEHLFEQFYRAHTSERGEESGTGLGLHISKGLIELHGGEIYVDSEKGEGTTFTFTLPLQQEDDVS